MRATKTLLAFPITAALLAGAASALLGLCGPFTDTADDPFCPFVLEVFYTGITTGTTATTYSPSDNVTRLQMAAFLSRTVDGVLKRGSRRAALKKSWTTQGEATLTANGLSFPSVAAFDGQRILVTNNGNDSVSLWKAADLTAIGSSITGAGTLPSGACSDRINFWVTLFNSDRLARF